MRILIIDDDAIFAHMLAQQLERLLPGYAVVAVDTADATRAAVRDAADLFDVLLLDVRLDGSNVDGVTLMEELRQLSPTSDAIVFTGYDVEVGLRAFDAGAYRYLTKPFDTRELVRILKVLHRERETRRERDWLTILADVTAQMQGTNEVHHLADIIVRGGLRFGFHRARLRLFEQADKETTSDPEMVGFSQAGGPRVEGFEGLRAPLSRLVYSRRAIEAGQPIHFDGRELGPGAHDEFYAAHGMALPKGHWFKIPLSSGERQIGALTLDNSDEERFFGADVIVQLTQVLALFGRQAADALERVRLHEQAKRQADEAKLLNEIGQQVTAAAVQGDLNDLLDEVRRQVGHWMDVTNFMVVLKDLETDALDFRRQYEEGEEEPRDRHWRSTDAGLSGYVVTHSMAVLTDDTEAFRSQHGIKRYGRPAQCWLGVPMSVDETTIGALIVQDYHRKATYTERHRRLLELIAKQVAGAIRLVYDLERRKELDRQDQALKDLRQALPQQVQELDFWHAILTTATHHDGSSFNRAVLFWYNETGQQMQGRMGIGYFRREDACEAWEKAEQADDRLSDYFVAPQRARLRPTPLEQQIVQWRLDAGAPQGPCHQVWAQGQRQVVSSAALHGCLPDELLQPPDLLDDTTEYPCALLPVKANDSVLGLLMVDNAFDGEPLRPVDLDKLEYLLETAMQRWQQDHLGGETYEQVLSLSHRVRTQVTEGQIKAALERLCHEAQQLTQADCVVIYPYHPSSGGYDLGLVSHVGLDKLDEFQETTKARPRQHGVTFAIVRSGTLVVSDVKDFPLSFGGHGLSEHAFIQRERIKALIGVPLREPATGKPLGVIYLDYRSSQEFKQHDLALAEHLAVIAADAIGYARVLTRAGEEQTLATARDQRRQRDMQLLANIQGQALASDADESKVVQAILQNTAGLFGRPADVTLALLSREAVGGENRQMRYDWRINRLNRPYKRPPKPGQGALDEALYQDEIQHFRNVLTIPILLDERTLAALMVKKRGRGAAFDAIEIEVAEHVATAAALALNSVRTRVSLQAVSETVSAVADKRGLTDTLKAVVDEARKVAPDIDCVTLWYEDQETGNLRVGPNRGVLDDKHKDPNLRTDDLVRRVMKRRMPIFAPTVERHRTLRGDFTAREQIVSAAAFPLRFGAEQQALGALFLNYRKAHEFSPVERTLFPIFANAAATAIHSAQTIELAERRRKRLETALAVATEASATMNEDDMVRAVLTVLRDEFQRGADDKTVPYFMRYDERDQVLELHPAAREFYQPRRPDYHHRVRLPLETEGKDEKSGITVRVARRALAEERIVIENIPNVHRDPDYVEVDSETKTEMCAGLVNGGQLLGVLVIKSARSAAFDQEDMKLLGMVAFQMKMARVFVEVTRQRVLDTKRLTVLAWRSEIAHAVRRSLTGLSSIKTWFDYYLATTSDPALGTSECRNQISASLLEFRNMLSTDLFALGEWKLSELIERIQSWVNGKKEWQSISFELPIPEPDVTMSCNPELLYWSLQNIITNSVEAINENGSIGLHVRHAFDSAIEIEIWDDGLGFPIEMYSRIGRDAWSTKGANRGYGLYNAMLFLEIMGGTLALLRPTADSSLAGAHVVIRVPLAKKLSSC